MQLGNAAGGVAGKLQDAEGGIEKLLVCRVGKLQVSELQLLQVSVPVVPAVSDCSGWAATFFLPQKGRVFTAITGQNQELE